MVTRRVHRPPKQKSEAMQEGGLPTNQRGERCAAFENEWIFFPAAVAVARAQCMSHTNLDGDPGPICDSSCQVIGSKTW